MSKLSLWEKMLSNIYVKTEPASEPLTAADVKEFGRIDGDFEDDFLTNTIKAVRISAEKYLGRALISQTLVMSLDRWPAKRNIELPRSPVSSITGIYTLDEFGTRTEYDSSNYYTRLNLDPSQISLKIGAADPFQGDRDFGGYEIEYVAGYGADPSDIPRDILEGLKLWVMYIYETRQLLGSPPPDAKMLLRNYRFLNI